jgi:phage terminase small subunit
MNDTSLIDKKEIRYEYESSAISLKDLAEKHAINYQTLKSWKSRDQWSKVATKSKKDATKKTKKGATNFQKLQPEKGSLIGNKNAVGNRGNSNPPNQFTERNTAAVKHGLYRTYLPDDDEARQIYDSIDDISPMDMLWENIKLKFTSIMRAQKIMFVKNKEEMIKELKKQKFEVVETKTEDGTSFEQVVTEEEWEFQFAWDRQATFLNAQSRAMSTLTSMMNKYEEMCRSDWSDEEQRLRLDKLKTEIEQMKGNDSDQDELIDNWVDAVMDDSSDLVETQ